MKAKRAAIYARVSTDENRQHPETQLRELRDFAERRGFEVVGEYIDHASGKTEERAGYKQLLEAEEPSSLPAPLQSRHGLQSFAAGFREPSVRGTNPLLYHVIWDFSLCALQIGC